MGVSYLSFRSNYSLLRGCRSPEEICRFARERNISTVGIADINNFYGLIVFLLAAGREGVRPVAGVAVEKDGRVLFTAHVMNRKGFSGICRVLTDLFAGDVPGEAPYRAGANAPGTSPAYDPVAALQERGWEGLAILSSHVDVIDRLAARERRGLYVQLSYGRPFSPIAGFARDRGLPTAAVQDTVFLDDG